jgi:serine protease
MHKLLAAVALAAGLTSLAQADQAPVHNLIVRLKPSADTTREAPQAARERLRAVAGEAGVRMTDERTIGERFHVMRLPTAQSGEVLDATMRRLRLHPDVSDVEPDVRIKRLAVPSDPSYADRQWNLQSSTVFASAVNMPAAWDISTGRAQGVVAVLDVGVRLGHPDLAGKLLPGYDFVSELDYANDGNGRDADPTDPGDWVDAADKRSKPSAFGSCDVEPSSWHGTFIAGQIAAATNNAVGMAGIDWQGKVLPVRIAGKCGALLSDLLDGMRWAAGLPVSGVPNNPNPARILNLSFGGDAACSPAYQAAIDDITDAGALLVVAAGNGAGTLKRPADCARVLAVGAVQDDGRKAAYSDFGANMGLMAPGGTSSRPIYSLDNAGSAGPTIETYGLKAGTSFASPQAAGVAALMLAVNPSLTPAQLVLRLQDSTRPHVVAGGVASCSTSGTVACNCTTATCGPGLLDAGSALALASSGQVPVAVIAPVKAPVLGSNWSLDGRASQAGSGSVTAYEWRQVEGARATIGNANAAQTSVSLPQSGTYVFRLRVTNSAGLRDETQVSVTASSGGDSGGSGDSSGGSMSWLWGAGLWLLAAMAWWLRRQRV